MSKETELKERMQKEIKLAEKSGCRVYEKDLENIKENEIEKLKEMSDFVDNSAGYKKINEIFKLGLKHGRITRTLEIIRFLRKVFNRWEINSRTQKEIFDKLAGSKLTEEKK